MPKNPFFSHGTSNEKLLYESLIIESISIYGTDVYYIPKKIIQEGGVFSENEIIEYLDSFLVEMYVSSVDSFEGDGNFLSTFGLSVKNQLELVVSRLRWQELVGQHQDVDNSIRPNEGDLIYMPLVNGLFEIVFVDGDTPFYQLSNIPTYKLKLELYEYNSETIDTGIDAIDEFEKEFSNNTITLEVDRSSAADEFDSYIEGEKVEQIINANGDKIKAEINTIDDNIIKLHGIELPDGINQDENFKITDTPNNIMNLKGLKSDVEFPIISIGTPFDNIDDNVLGSESNKLETKGNSFISFDESNPFGDPQNV